MDSWKELSDQVEPCPICGHLEIMMKIGKGPKWCECLRCGEKSIELDIDLIQSVMVWNDHCRVIEKTIQRARIGNVVLERDGKKAIDINEVNKLINAISLINQLNVDQVEFVENGDIIDIDMKTRTEFNYTGLNFIDFIKTRFWEEENKGEDDVSTNCD